MVFELDSGLLQQYGNPATPEVTRDRWGSLATGFEKGQELSLKYQENKREEEKLLLAEKELEMQEKTRKELLARQEKLDKLAEAAVIESARRWDIAEDRNEEIDVRNKAIRAENRKRAEREEADYILKGLDLGVLKDSQRVLDEINKGVAQFPPEERGDAMYQAYIQHPENDKLYGDDLTSVLDYTRDETLDPEVGKAREMKQIMVLIAQKKFKEAKERLAVVYDTSPDSLKLTSKPGDSWMMDDAFELEVDEGEGGIKTHTQTYAQALQAGGGSDEEMTQLNSYIKYMGQMEVQKARAVTKVKLGDYQRNWDAISTGIKGASTEPGKGQISSIKARFEQDYPEVFDGIGVDGMNDVAYQIAQQGAFIAPILRINPLKAEDMWAQIAYANSSKIPQTLFDTITFSVRHEMLSLAKENMPESEYPSFESTINDALFGKEQPVPKPNDSEGGTPAVSVLDLSKGSNALVDANEEVVGKASGQIIEAAIAKGTWPKGEKEQEAFIEKGLMDAGYVFPDGPSLPKKKEQPSPKQRLSRQEEYDLLREKGAGDSEVKAATKSEKEKNSRVGRKGYMKKYKELKKELGGTADEITVLMHKMGYRIK